MENNTKQTLSTPMAIVLAGFLVMVGIIVAKMPAKEPTFTDTKSSEVGIPLAPLSAEDHVFGDLSKAEIVIVEFSDTECPFCKTFHNALHNTVTKYNGKVAWVYRHFPLDSIHPKTRMEARATECVATIAGNDAFWKYLDMIFTNTPANNGLDAGLLPTFAVNIGVDKEKFANCFASTEMDAKVEAQYQDGVKAGATGTPYTIVMAKDGTKIPVQGANEAELNKTIDLLLK